MGMAASQARLLCITARIHDVEQQAQAIQNAKIQLATQSDQAYKEYNAALDAQSLTLMTTDNSGQKTRVVANFKNLASFNALNTTDDKNYIITHKNYGLVVDDFIKEGYDDFINRGGSDAYSFAIFMMSGGDPNLFSDDLIGDLDNAKLATYDEKEGENTKLDGIYNSIIELVNEYNDEESFDWGSSTIYDASTFINDNATPEDIKKYEELIAAFENELFGKYSSDVYRNLQEENGLLPAITDFDNIEFQKYVNIFRQIQLCGGCTSINSYDGLNGDAATNSEFLQNMIEAGLFRIGTVEYDDTTGKPKKYEATSPSSDISLSYVNTSEIDNRALKKAEAKYDDAMRKINNKDKKFDLDLSKLETERSALTTEYDSVKKVIDENIERTFGIFS